MRNTLLDIALTSWAQAHCNVVEVDLKASAVKAVALVARRHLDLVGALQQHGDQVSLHHIFARQPDFTFVVTLHFTQ